MWYRPGNRRPGRRRSGLLGQGKVAIYHKPPVDYHTEQAHSTRRCLTDTHRMLAPPKLALRRRARDNAIVPERSLSYPSSGSNFLVGSSHPRLVLFVAHPSSHPQIAFRHGHQNTRLAVDQLRSVFDTTHARSRLSKAVGHINSHCQRITTQSVQTARLLNIYRPCPQSRLSFPAFLLPNCVFTTSSLHRFVLSLHHLPLISCPPPMLTAATPSFLLSS